MSISFPYREKQIKEGKIPEPIATLTVKTAIGERELDFLIDSGADTTVLPLVWAYLFNFKPNTKKKTYIGGIEGGQVTAFPSKIEIKIGKRFRKIRCLFVKSKVMPLLGRLDFWQQFSLKFDNKKTKSIFYPLA